MTEQENFEPYYKRVARNYITEIYEVVNLIESLKTIHPNLNFAFYREQKQLAEECNAEIQQLPDDVEKWDKLRYLGAIDQDIEKRMAMDYLWTELRHKRMIGKPAITPAEEQKQLAGYKESAQRAMVLIRETVKTLERITLINTNVNLDFYQNQKLMAERTYTSMITSEKSSAGVRSDCGKISDISLHIYQAIERDGLVKEVYLKQTS